MLLKKNKLRVQVLCIIPIDNTVDTWASPFGMGVRIALEEEGVNYEYTEQDLRNKSPLLLQMKPVYKKVPSSHSQWETKLNPGSGDFVDKKVYRSGRKAMTVKGEEKNDFISSLKLLVGELGDKPYFEGDKLGSVHVALIAFYCWFHGYETYGKFRIEVECDL
ncbi:hypothetical protein DKX38_026030 [Salix brachista]|nr:hypothetical protein DKX38_026030 [Salix brachista]